MYGIHPRKLTWPLKRDYFSRESLWTNHWFSGDMLVLRGVFTLTIFIYQHLPWIDTKNALGHYFHPMEQSSTRWMILFFDQGKVPVLAAITVTKPVGKTPMVAMGRDQLCQDFLEDKWWQIVSLKLPFCAAKNRQNDREFQPSIFGGIYVSFRKGSVFWGVNNWTTHLKKDHAFRGGPNILTSTLWSKLGSPKTTMDLGAKVVPKKHMWMKP